MMRNRILLITAALLAAFVAACILVYRMLDSGRLNPLALLFIAALISIALPMLRANFFPSAKDCQNEFDFHNRRRDAFIRQQITHKLGPDGLPPMNADQGTADYLSSVLEKEAHRSDENLRFALLSALAQHYEHHGDPHAAIRSRNLARQIRPRDFITRFQLARNYEWLEDRGAALEAYRKILDAPVELSRAMRRLTRQRIKELENR